MNGHCGLYCVMLAAAAALSGCGGPRPVAGGSSGVIRSGDTPLCDIQVTVHQMDGGAPKVVGFGVSGTDGRFTLVQNGARGPLWLSPGEYRCTVESVGPVPMRFPKNYGSAETTPLKFSWSNSDRQIELDLPSPSAGR